MNRKERSDIKRKLDVLNYAKEVGNINRACRHYGVSKTIYFKWLKRYEEKGEKGLINNKPCPENLFTVSSSSFPKISTFAKKANP